MNGLGAQGDPRGADAPNPVTYPFTGLGGVTVQQAGQRQARLRHQHRRRRALRPLPRLDPGPAQARPATQHRRGHEPRRRGLPADVGARRRASATTPAGSRRWPRRRPLIRGLRSGLTVKQVLTAGGHAARAARPRVHLLRAGLLGRTCPRHQAVHRGGPPGLTEARTAERSFLAADAQHVTWMYSAPPTSSGSLVRTREYFPGVTQARSMWFW